jgi:hypothetical protein
MKMIAALTDGPSVRGYLAGGCLPYPTQNRGRIEPMDGSAGSSSPTSDDPHGDTSSSHFLGVCLWGISESAVLLFIAAQRVTKQLGWPHIPANIITTVITIRYKAC